MHDPGPTARAARWTATAMLLFSCAAFVAVAPVAAQDVTILRYEALAELAVTDVSSDAATPAELKVSFNAFATRFAMTLERN